MDYGYSRCSTNETKQDINRQVRELKAAGAVEIFMEYEHGDAKVKSQQAQMFAQAQAGDTIIVLEVSRLARSTQQLCEIIERVREKRLRLVIVGSITLDCREGKADPMSEAFLQMAWCIPAIFLRHYPAFKNGQLNISELARVCDLSRTTVYKYLDILGAKT